MKLGASSKNSTLSSVWAHVCTLLKWVQLFWITSLYQSQNSSVLMQGQPSVTLICFLFYPFTDSSDFKSTSNVLICVKIPSSCFFFQFLQSFSFWLLSALYTPPDRLAMINLYSFPSLRWHRMQLANISLHPVRYSLCSLQPPCRCMFSHFSSSDDGSLTRNVKTLFFFPQMWSDLVSTRTVFACTIFASQHSSYLKGCKKRL